MDIEQFRWWHWVLLSLGIGYLLAFVNSSPIEPTGLTEQQVLQFQRDIMHAPIGKDHVPWAKNIRVYPRVDKGAMGKPVQIVTYEALAPKKGGGPNDFYYRPDWFCAPIPYAITAQGPVLADPDPIYRDEVRKAAEHLPPGVEKFYTVKKGDTLQSIVQEAYGSVTGQNEEAVATANQAFRYGKSVDDLIQKRRMSAGQKILIPWPPEKELTVRDWLNDAGKDYSWIHYQFAWWKVPRYCNMVWMGSTFAIVGVIWPMTLSLLTGAGLGRAHGDKDAYDLTRFGSEKRKARAVATPALSPEEAAAQHQKLVTMNEALMASVSEGVDPAGNKSKDGVIGPVAGAAGGTQRTFTPQKADPPAPLPEKTEEEKEYVGQFYPVAHAVVKPADSSAGREQPKQPDPKKP